jgi:hypothetical protein
MTTQIKSLPQRQSNGAPSHRASPRVAERSQVPPVPRTSVTAAKLRSLPWPEAILDRSLQLSADDTYRVGQLIVEQIHGGERNTQRTRKEWSLRRIQQHVLRRASFATLARCVQTYETCRSLGMEPPLGDLRAGHLLNMTHLNRSRQKQLIERVGKQGMSVQALRQKTGRVAGQGRKRTPGFLRAISALGKQDLLADIEQLAQMDRVEARRLAAQLVVLQEQLKQVQKQLKRRTVD